jgi:hypothetical protein
MELARAISTDLLAIFADRGRYIYWIYTLFGRHPRAPRRTFWRHAA